MSSNNGRIQRVPALLIAEEEDEMMKKKKNDYYPKVASIGPYHYGKPELAQVEAFKPFAVDLLVRSREEKDFFYQKVLDMIGQVRNCYEKESVDEYSDADLAQMMLRDASLIIAEMEIYLEHRETSRKRKAETSRKTKAMIDHFGRLTGAVLFRDFILVENQIPLCVVQLLIKLRHGADEGRKMINNYVNKCIFGEIRPIVKSSRVPLHLLEFMHIILVYDGEAKESSRGSYSTGDSDMAVMAPNHTLLLGSPQHATKTSNRSDEESSRGSYSTEDIDMEVMAPNHTLLPGSPQHATKTSNRSDEESSSGELGGASAAPNQTLTLGSRKHATETANWSIDESTSSELGAPGDPNHTSTLGPRKPPTQTSNWSIEEGCSGKSGGAPEAPNHPLMVGSPTETSNRANQESIFTEGIRRMLAYQVIPHITPAFATHTLTLGPRKPPTETSNCSIEEGCRGKKVGGAPNSYFIDQCAVRHTLKLEPRKPATKNEESSSGELGAPGASNHTLKVGRPRPRPRVPPTETSNWSSIEEGCSGLMAPVALMAPNHTLMLGSHKHATETSNKAKKVTHWFRKVMELKARGIHFRPSATQSLLSNKAETSNQAKKVTHSFRKVMELKARGIHFRPSATQSLLDVRFKSGFFHATLQLPEMFVSHYSKPFFKNLVAYELLPGVETEPTVTSYINLMQSLVERPEDLEELRERKIVYNQLGSDEEALNVFKDINTHGASDDELYFKVREEIQAHYNSRIKTWIAELIHTHFRSPWTFTAFLAAAAIIALTAAQLYYDVHPVADKTPTSS